MFINVSIKVFVLLISHISVLLVYIDLLFKTIKCLTLKRLKSHNDFKNPFIFHLKLLYQKTFFLF